MSEGFDNGDLPVGEWFDLGVVERDHAQQISTFQYRHRKEAAVGLDSFRRIFVAWVGQHVGDIDRLPLKGGTAGHGLAINSDRISLKPFVHLGGDIVGGRRPQQLALRAKEECAFRRAQTRRALDHGIEHRLQIEGRTANDLKHLRGRGLLRQRFLKLAPKPSGVGVRDNGPANWGRAAFDAPRRFGPYGFAAWFCITLARSF